MLTKKDSTISRLNKVIDKNKVQRAEIVERKNRVSCIFFDGRMDVRNITINVENSVKLYSLKIN